MCARERDKEKMKAMTGERERERELSSLSGPVIRFICGPNELAR